MNEPHIAFIGGGNMAASLIGGLVADGWPPERIHVAEPDNARRQALADRWPVNVSGDNAAAASQAQLLVLAVKPQVLRDVAVALTPAVQQTRPLVLSIAAGVREADISRWLGGGMAVVRTMPNTPALVQTGATGMYANTLVTDEQRDLAESVMRAVGLTLWVDDEAMLDAVTAVSGSGPAYFFLVMEALEQAGAELGLSPEQARLLSLQTALGAARMAIESDDGPAELRRRVTSPGGTTERAIAVLEDGKLREMFAAALRAARDRSAELAQALGEQ